MSNTEDPISKHKSRERATTLRFARFYVGFSCIWIVLSSLLLSIHDDVSLQVAILHASRGLLFVLVSTIALYIYMSRHLRKAEHEITITRQRLRDWSQYANDIFLLFNENGKILEANTNALAAYGFSAEELTSKALRDIVEDPAGLDERWAKLLATGELRETDRHRRADGTTFPIEFSARLIPTSQGIMAHAIVRDITESEEARKQISRLRDIYAALSQTNQCIVRTTDQKELFQAACDIAIQYGHFKLAWIGQADDDGSLRAVASAGDSVGYLRGEPMSLDPRSPLSRSATARALLTGLPVLFNQSGKEEDLLPWRARMAEHGIKSNAAFPLFLGNQPHGVLALYADSEGFFTQELTNLLAEMANDISYALGRIESENHRKLLTEALAESHAWLDGMLEGIDIFIAAVNREMVLRLSNPAHSDFMRQQGAQAKVGSTFVPESQECALGWQKALEGESCRQGWSISQNGTTVYFDSRFGPLYDRDRNLIGAFHFCRNVTDQKELELELQKLSTAVMQSPVTVVITDTKGCIEYVNPAFTATSGYSAEEVMGKNPRILKSGKTRPEEYAAMWNCLKNGDSWSGLFYNKRKDGSFYWEEAVIAPVRDSEGRIRQYIAVKQDVTARTEAEQRARFLAFHDPLTRLPNRIVGQSRLEDAMEQADANGLKAALLFVDLDNFKRVNDSLGHEVGDHFLQALVERLKNSIRNIDTLSRLGGDEFLIILSRVENIKSIEHIAARIQAAVADPYQVDGFELSTSVSIGAAIYPDHGSTFEELRRKADLAMYSAKKDGRDTYRIYHQSMETDAHEYLQILNGLRKALERNEFMLHYQPQIEIATGRVVAAEALIRWNHPQLGLISPEKFIPVAEDSGLIVAIGNWVIGEACRQASKWHDRGFPKLRMAVNLSAAQLRRGNLLQVISQALNDACLEPECLELELTESVMIQDRTGVAAALNQVKQLGVKLAIDDFGTGYSSFAYLRDFRLDRLKIDQRFVRNIGFSPRDEAIVRSVVKLAGEFGLETVAEGVDCDSAASVVRNAGCDYVQGYLFARPMSAEAFCEYLNSHDSEVRSIFPQNDEGTREFAPLMFKRSRLRSS